MTILGLAVAVLPIGYLHVAGSGVIDPVRRPISDYVTVPNGALLLATSFTAMIVSALPLVVGLRAVPGCRLAQGLLLTWCVALAVAAIFPTNPPGSPAETAAVVHRYAAGWLFVSLPWACWLLGRHCALNPMWRYITRSLRLLSTLVAAASAAMLSGYLISAGEASPVWWVGLLQRGLLALEIALIAAAARAVRAASDPSPLLPTTRPQAHTYEKSVR